MEDLFDGQSQVLRGAELLYEFSIVRVNVRWGIEDGLGYPFFSKSNLQSWIAASPTTRRRAANVPADSAIIMRVRRALEKKILPTHLL